MIRGNPLAGSKRFPMSDSLTVDSCLINRLSSVYFFLELVCCGLALGLFCFRADEAIQFGCGLIADWSANGKYAFSRLFSRGERGKVKVLLVLGSL